MSRESASKETLKKRENRKINQINKQSNEIQLLEETRENAVEDFCGLRGGQAKRSMACVHCSFSYRIQLRMGISALSFTILPRYLLLTDIAIVKCLGTSCS